MGTILGVLIIRDIVFLESILGSPYFGKLPDLPTFTASSSNLHQLGILASQWGIRQYMIYIYMNIHIHMYTCMYIWFTV